MKIPVNLRHDPSKNRYYLTLPNFPVGENKGWFVSECANPELHLRLLRLQHRSPIDQVNLAYEGSADEQHLTTTKHIFDQAELVLQVEGATDTLGIEVPAAIAELTGERSKTALYAAVRFHGSPGLGWNQQVECLPVRHVEADRYDWVIKRTNVSQEGYQLGDILQDVETYYFTPVAYLAEGVDWGVPYKGRTVLEKDLGTFRRQALAYVGGEIPDELTRARYQGYLDCLVDQYHAAQHAL